MQAAAEPIDRPRHHHVELRLGSISTQPIECRALVPAFGAADAVVLVDMDDIATHAARNVTELALLVGRGLPSGP